MNRKSIFTLCSFIFLICCTPSLMGMEARSDQPNVVSKSISLIRHLYTNNAKETADTLGVTIDELHAFFSDKFIQVANEYFGDDMGSVSPLTTTFITEVGKEVIQSELNDQSANPTILIAGAGLGRNVPQILDTVPYAIIYINDINPKNYNVLAAIKNYWVETKYQQNRFLAQQWSRLQFIAGDVSQLQFENELFDAILADNVLHFMSPSQIIDFFQRALKWLKPNGKIKIAARTPNSGISAHLKEKILTAKKKLTAMNVQLDLVNNELANLIYADHWDFLQKNLKNITFLNLNPLEFEYHKLFLLNPINNTVLTLNLLEKLQKFSGLKFYGNISFFNLMVPTANNLFSEPQFTLVKNKDEPTATYVSAVLVKPQTPIVSDFDTLRILAAQDKKNLHDLMDNRYLILATEIGKVYLLSPEIQSKYQLYNLVIAQRQLERAKSNFKKNK